VSQFERLRSDILANRAREQRNQVQATYGQRRVGGLF